MLDISLLLQDYNCLNNYYTTFITVLYKFCFHALKETHQIHNIGTPENVDYCQKNLLVYTNLKNYFQTFLVTCQQLL